MERTERREEGRGEGKNQSEERVGGQENETGTTQGGRQAKEGKLDNDDSNNSLDPPGGPLPEASLLSLSFTLLLSFSPSASPPSFPPIFPPAAVSLLINFSLLTRAQSCRSPQLACETALRSALPLPRSHNGSRSAPNALGSRSEPKGVVSAVTLPRGKDHRSDRFHPCTSPSGCVK